MARQYGVEKVNLLQLLALIADNEGVQSRDVIRLIMDTFACSKRTAADALSILRQAGCVEAVPDSNDRRRHLYFLTSRGWQRFGDPYGGMLLRFARQLFTTCPSPGVRMKQHRLRENELTLETVFNRAEQSLLNHRLGVSPIENRLATGLALGTGPRSE